jgi:hypothetical protein
MLSDKNFQRWQVDNIKIRTRSTISAFGKYPKRYYLFISTDQLGQRLQESEDESQKLGALLCCICSGNLNHLVDVWIGDQSKKAKEDSPDELQVITVRRV